MSNIISFIVNQSDLRLDQYLVERLPDYSRSKIQDYIKRGHVKINGEIGKSSLKLKSNDAIECCFEPMPIDTAIIPEKLNLDIIYEDAHLAVINKPAGLVVHPGSGNYGGTLLNGLLYHFKTLSKGGSHRPGIVHRLDKDTSGVILIAKNDQSHEHLNKQFSNRLVKKEYIALVWGKLEEEGCVEHAIDRHPKNRKILTVVQNKGRNSITYYKRVEYLAPLSMVNLYPKTGRKHQLRVHMKSIGHPIFNDSAYGGGAKYAKSFHIKYTQLINRLLKTIPRVALHARKIEILHPESEKWMCFEAPLPLDLTIALEILKNENS